MGNLKYNYIIKQIHQVLGNVIRMTKIGNDNCVFEDDPWKLILVASDFSVCFTLHNWSLGGI